MSHSDRLNGAELERIFPGDSEMAGRMRAFDWSASALGPAEYWPEGLRVAAHLCLTSRHPTLLWWGPELAVLYNDAFLPWLSDAKHPRALGQPGRVGWSESWETIGPMLEGVLATGQATWSVDMEQFLDRRLWMEEAFMTVTYAPILGGDGQTVDGIFCACFESTGHVVGARRLETLRKLGVRAAEARTVEAACQQAAAVMGENTRDIPLAAIYVIGENGDGAKLCAATLPADVHSLPGSVSALEDDPDSPWPLASVLRTNRSAESADLVARGVRLPGGPWPEPPRQAIALPIRVAEDQLVGLLMVGVSPRRPLDDGYRRFFDLLASHIATAVSNARAHEEERRNAEALVERGRAETAFFSTVSHEFRAPLRLIVGLVDDHLAEFVGGPLSNTRELLDAVRESEERLRQLVVLMPAAVYTCDLEGRITFYNRRAVEIWGREPELEDRFCAAWRLWRTDGTLLPHDQTPMATCVREGLSVKGMTIVVEQSNGHRAVVSVNIAPLVDRRGRRVGAINVFEDITEQKRAEEALRDSAARLQVLSRRVVEVQEHERRHLARELHDEIGQALSAIGVNLQSIRSVCDGAAAYRLEESIHLVDEAIQQVRNLSINLRPSMLDDLGLVAAVRWYADRQGQRAGFAVHLAVETSAARLPGDLQIACYRVLQEALTNVARHAHARHVWIELRQGDDDVNLAVRDDGVGFDPVTAHGGGAQGESFGLLGIQERAELLGGRAEIRSQPGHGTTIRAWFPIASPPSALSSSRGSQ